MNTEYKSMSPIELTALLKKLSRDIQKLQAEERTLPHNSQESFIRGSEIEAQIEELKGERTGAAKQLLKLDQEKTEALQIRAKEARKELDTLVDAHLEQLTAWARKAAALSEMAEEYEVLLKSASAIERLNNTAARAGLARPIGGLTPQAYRQRLRSTIVAAFGVNPLAEITLLRDGKSRSFSLIGDVEQVIKNTSSTDVA